MRTAIIVLAVAIGLPIALFAGWFVYAFLGHVFRGLRDLCTSGPLTQGEAFRTYGAVAIAFWILIVLTAAVLLLWWQFELMGYAFALPVAGSCCGLAFTLRLLVVWRLRESLKSGGFGPKDYCD